MKTSIIILLLISMYSLDGADTNIDEIRKMEMEIEKQERAEKKARAKEEARKKREAKAKKEAIRKKRVRAEREARAKKEAIRKREARAKREAREEKRAMAEEKARKEDETRKESKRRELELQNRLGGVLFQAFSVGSVGISFKFGLKETDDNIFKMLKADLGFSGGKTTRTSYDQDNKPYESSSMGYVSLGGGLAYAIMPRVIIYGGIAFIKSDTESNANSGAGLVYDLIVVPGGPSYQPLGLMLTIGYDTVTESINFGIGFGRGRNSSAF